MDNMARREMNVTMFEENMWLCERTQEMLRAIEESRKETVVYKDSELNTERWQDGISDKKKTACSVQILENWMAHKIAGLRLDNEGGRFGIVYFGSVCYPGGDVLRGGCGTEEYLCRQSTLYPCLNSEFVWKEYYGKNLHGRVIYGVKDEGISQYLYIPNVVCTERNCRENTLWKYGDRFDVICCGGNRERMEKDVVNICTVARRHKIDGLIFLPDKVDLSLDGKELEHIYSQLG